MSLGDVVLEIVGSSSSWFPLTVPPLARESMLQSEAVSEAAHLGDAVTVTGSIFARMCECVDCDAESDSADVIQEPLVFRTLDFIPTRQVQVHLQVNMSLVSRSRAIHHFYCWFVSLSFLF